MILSLQDSPDEEKPVILIQEPDLMVEPLLPVASAQPEVSPAVLETAPFIREEPLAEEPTYLVSPVKPQSELFVRMLTIVLRSTGDKTRTYCGCGVSMEL